MGNLADLARNAGRMRGGHSRSVVDVISFVESSWGLDMKLFPVQRVILKAHYGLTLDNTDHKAIPVSDWRRENYRYFSEAEYLRYLYEEGRCNISEVEPGKERREMILSIGRRSGKTLLSSCIAAYETYKLLSKGHPQAYYGLPDSNVIQLISVATDRDQAGLLYREVLGHYTNCTFFKPYMANYTQSFATFQTPEDIDKFGAFADNAKARFSIKATFRSCVAKGLRGAGNIVVILDEVAHFTDAGQSSAAEVYDAVVPSTSAFSPKDPKDARIPIGPVEGRIILISSPLGKQGQFYKLFEIGMRGGKAAENMLCVQAPTWEVNPTVPSTEFEKNYVKDARVFFTEFGAEFSDRTRGWIEDAKDLMACINEHARPKKKAPPRQPHYMGIDVGLAGDGSAVAIGHTDERGNIILDLIEQIRAGEGKYVDLDRLEFDDVADWIFGLSRQFFVTEGLFDQWAGIPLEQALAKRGLKQMKSERFTKPKISQMFQNFKDMMFDKRLQLYDWPIPDGEIHCEYISELLELQAEVQSKYVTLVSAPNMRGKYDDLSDALVRMVWVASQHMGKVLSTSGSRRSLFHYQKQRPVSPALNLVARRRRLLGGSHPSRQPAVALAMSQWGKKWRKR